MNLRIIARTAISKAVKIPLNFSLLIFIFCFLLFLMHLNIVLCILNGCAPIDTQKRLCYNLDTEFGKESPR